MTKKQFCISLIILAIFGYLGGLSGFYLLPSSARADNNRTITCNKLVVQDNNGHESIVIDATGPKGTAGIFLSNTTGYKSFIRGDILSLLDPRGVYSIYTAQGATIFHKSKSRLIYGAIDDDPCKIIVTDNQGKPLWSTP